MVCGNCFDHIQRERPRDSHTAFVRAVLFGLVGFAIGLIAYAGFEIMTGISIGYLALAVGWIVGKAMMIGSGGIGGRRYQLTAILLTYAAVSMAGITPGDSAAVKEKKHHRARNLRQAAPGKKGGPAPPRWHRAA